MWGSKAILVMLAVMAIMVESNVASAAPIRWGDVTGPVTATSIGVRIPSNQAELATMTPADESRIRAVMATRATDIARLVQQGRITPEGSTSSARVALRRPPRTLAAIPASHLYLDARCGIWWTDYPGSGTQVWGGGWTRSNATAFVRLYGGNFYKNGGWLSSFGAQLTGTNAESYSAGNWRAWWEPTHSYFVESDHDIYVSGGGLDWGPAHCTHQVFK